MRKVIKFEITSSVYHLYSSMKMINRSDSIRVFDLISQKEVDIYVSPRSKFYCMFLFPFKHKNKIHTFSVEDCGYLKSPKMMKS